VEKTPEQLLKNAKSILLVDWPDQSIPRSLVKAGLTVFGFSPDGYSRAGVVSGQPEKAEGTSVFLPRKDETDHLVFEACDRPVSVDMVCIYRPEAEHESIFKNHVLPFNAKIIWLQPPVTSSAIKQSATANGITIIEGINLAEIAAKI
jgi:hypothetical protein